MYSCRTECSKPSKWSYIPCNPCGSYDNCKPSPCNPCGSYDNCNPCNSWRSYDNCNQCNPYGSYDNYNPRNTDLQTKSMDPDPQIESMDPDHQIESMDPDPQIESMASQIELTDPQIESISEELKCKICLERKMSIVFKNCGHVASCDVCCYKMDKCPICRNPYEYTDIMKVFIS